MAYNINELKKIPLAEFCIDRLGYTPCKSADSERWRVFIGPSGQSIVMRSTPAPSGDYLFFTREGQKGNIIHLLKLFHGYKSIAQILADYGSGQLPKYKPPVLAAETPIKDATEFVGKAYNAYLARCKIGGINYLSRRGISNNIISDYKIAVAERELFLPLYLLKNGKFEAATGITYSFDGSGSKRHPYFLKGLGRRGSYSLLTPRKRPLEYFDTLMVFESPVGALSYAQLFPEQKESILLSFCGGFGDAFKKQLLLLIKKLKLSNVVLCLDNDDFGRSAATALKKIIKDVNVALKFPTKKDWNDELNSKVWLKSNGKISLT